MWRSGNLDRRGSVSRDGKTAENKSRKFVQSVTAISGRRAGDIRTAHFEPGQNQSARHHPPRQLLLILIIFIDSPTSPGFLTGLSITAFLPLPCSSLSPSPFPCLTLSIEQSTFSQQAALAGSLCAAAKESYEVVHRFFERPISSRRWELEHGYPHTSCPTNEFSVLVIMTMSVLLNSFWTNADSDLFLILPLGLRMSHFKSCDPASITDHRCISGGFV